LQSAPNAGELFGGLTRSKYIGKKGERLGIKKLRASDVVGVKGPKKRKEDAEEEQKVPLITLRNNGGEDGGVRPRSGMGESWVSAA